MMTEMDVQQSLRSSSRERSALILELVASAVEGNDLGPTGDPFEPSARCINDTKKRQLVTRFGLPRLRCFVCHLHHMWATPSLAVLRLMSLQEMSTLQHTRSTKGKSTQLPSF